MSWHLKYILKKKKIDNGDTSITKELKRERMVEEL